MGENEQGRENERYSIHYYDNGNGSQGGQSGDPTLGNQYYYQEPQTNSDPYAGSYANGGEAQPEPNARGGALKLLASAIVFGLVAGTVMMGVSQFAKNYVFKQEERITTNAGEGATIQKTEPAGNVVEGAQKEASAISDVVDNVMPSIVSIHVTTKDTGYSFFGQYYEQEVPASGSGFLVGENEDELLIVTNNHVVEGTNSIEVTFVDEESVAAVVKGTDSEADLAVVAVNLKDVKAETKSKIRVATLGDSEAVKVGQMAIAIGNALGYGQSVTVGYISAKDREIEVTSSDRNGTNKMKVLQTDAAINPGNSGGALLNVNGEVVGINSVKYADAAVEGMGYAIPISRAVPIINELMKREILKEEEKGYLGISGASVSQEANELYAIPYGVLVSEVAKGGAAEEAGVKKGDIITAVNDVEVMTIESLKEKVNSYRVGTKFTLSVKRNESGQYEEIKIEVTLKASDTLDALTEGAAGTTPRQDGGSSEEPRPNGDEGRGNPNGSFDEDSLREFFEYFR